MSDVLTLSTPAHPDHFDVVELSEAARAAWAEEPVTFTAVLPVPRRAVQFVADLLEDHWRQLGTRPGRRALQAWDQAVAFWRWMLDDVEPDRLALDLDIGRSTAHRDVNETLTLVAEQAPSLHGALLAAQAAGHHHVNLDGTLMRTDRVSTPGPTSKNKKSGQTSNSKIDLFWSGKHKCHGGNIQVVTAPDGWPLYVCEVRPGREHDVTVARTDPDLLATLEAWCDEHHKVLADLGYQGEPDRFVLPVKADANGKDTHGQLIPLTEDQQCLNALHSATRARAEQGNAWLKMTFKILRKVRIDPWRIGKLAAASLVLLHVMYDRTT